MWQNARNASSEVDYACLTWLRRGKYFPGLTTLRILCILVASRFSRKSWRQQFLHIIGTYILYIKGRCISPNTVFGGCEYEYFCERRYERCNRTVVPFYFPKWLPSAAITDSTLSLTSEHYPEIKSTVTSAQVSSAEAFNVLMILTRRFHSRAFVSVPPKGFRSWGFCLVRDLDLRSGAESCYHLSIYLAKLAPMCGVTAASTFLWFMELLRKIAKIIIKLWGWKSLNCEVSWPKFARSTGRCIIKDFDLFLLLFHSLRSTCRWSVGTWTGWDFSPATTRLTPRGRQKSFTDCMLSFTIKELFSIHLIVGRCDIQRKRVWDKIQAKISFHRILPAADALHPIKPGEEAEAKIPVVEAAHFTSRQTWSSAGASRWRRTSRPWLSSRPGSGAPRRRSSRTSSFYPTRGHLLWETCQDNNKLIIWWTKVTQNLACLG